MNPVSHYLSLVFVVLIGVFGIWNFMNHSRKNKPPRRRFAHLFMLPHLIDRLQLELGTRARNNKPLLTRRELYGWIVVLVIVAMALVLGPA